MKAGFLNSLVYTVFIILIIAGITPGIVSAVDAIPGASTNSDNENTNTASSDDTPPVPAATIDNLGSDSTGDGNTVDTTLEETPTEQPTSTEQPTVTETEQPTETEEPTPSETETEVPTVTEQPTETEQPSPTEEPTVTETEQPTETETEVPTVTEQPTETEQPSPTEEQTPNPTEQPTSVETETPTQTPQETPTQEQQITPTPSPSDSGSNSDSGSDSNSGSHSGSHSKSSMGSGVSQEAPENIAAKELDTENIISGYHITYNFTENATPITYIEYDAKRTFRKTTSIAEVLVNKSSLVSELPYGKIYRHVNIWVGQQGAGLPTSIENGFVGFKVERAWIRDNSVNETFVTLQWFDREWQPLETEKIGEDEVYLYFKAKTPGYSSFAITEFTPEDAQKAEIEGTSQIQRALQSLTDNTASVLHANMEKQILAQKAKKTAKIIMALSLPLFMLIVGYCIFKKKI